MVQWGDGFIFNGHYYGINDLEKWERFWAMCKQNSDAALFAQMAQDDAEFERQRRMGKKWKHTCPMCGAQFENDEPEKGYLCDACTHKELLRIADELQAAGKL